MDHTGRRYLRPRPPGATMSRRIARGHQTARFLRRAAPAFIRELARDYSRPSLPAPYRPDPASWPDTGLHAAWLGHSTVLLKINGVTLITDPVFSSRVGLNLGPVTLGIKRIVDLALPLHDLPPIDLILLSHAHMDHFDIPSLRQLESRKTTVVTAFRTTDLLRSRRYAAAHELRWGDCLRVGRVQLTAFEVRHWGARMRSDVYRGFNGYVIEIDGFRLLYAGDTAYTDCFRSLRSSRAIDLAVMPIGAYDPWIHVHCNPEQALQMATDAGAERILPVHHKTFRLGREGYNEPVERLMNAIGPSPDRVCVTEIGEEFHL